MRRLLGMSLLCLFAFSGCTKPSVSVVVVPDDRVLQDVYDRDGRPVLGRHSISDGWLRELIQDLENCSKIETTFHIDRGFFPGSVSTIQAPPEIVNLPYIVRSEP